MNECYGCRCVQRLTKTTTTTITKMNRLTCIVIYLFATSSLAYGHGGHGVGATAASSGDGELTASPKNNDMAMVHTGGQPGVAVSRDIVHVVASAEEHGSTAGGPKTTPAGEYVATTPKIDISSTKAPSRYEQGLEDYEEAVARVEQTKETQRAEKLINTFSVISMLNQAWQKVATDVRPAAGSRAMTDVLVTDDVASNASSISDVGKGRYIQGDPLSGYYDFIITEGSYKFWAAFQLATALLMIYSTFAAIYYSKVNPIVSDYDYVSYLGGRSLADDPELEDTQHPAASLLQSGWIQTAAHSFEFVLDAIDRMPAK